MTTTVAVAGSATRPYFAEDAPRPPNRLAELLWIVKGTVTEQRTTIADFNAIPEHGKAAMVQGSLRNPVTAIEEVLMLRRSY